jgi:hypothetical protein
MMVLLVLEDFAVQSVQRNIHLVSAKVKSQPINLNRRKEKKQKSL